MTTPNCGIFSALRQRSVALPVPSSSFSLRSFHSSPIIPLLVFAPRSSVPLHRHFSTHRPDEFLRRNICRRRNTVKFPRLSVSAVDVGRFFLRKNPVSEFHRCQISPNYSQFLKKLVNFPRLIFRRIMFASSCNVSEIFKAKYS